MIEILLNLLTIELLLILTLFLRELGITAYIYEELYTHPSLKPFIKLFGDILYMVGGSVIGAVVYTFYTSTLGFQIIPAIVGFIFITYGAYLRDIKARK
jgi:ABC-type multidrug transport system permease subunit